MTNRGSPSVSTATAADPPVPTAAGAGSAPPPRAALAPMPRTRAPAGRTARHILFVAWRDLANPRAGGSEILVDRLAEGMAARGDRVTLLCGGPACARIR